MNVIELTLALCRIPSTTGEEQALVEYLSEFLGQAGYQISLQAVGTRHNLLALKNTAPKILMTTHLDTVPPYFEPILENGILRGRGVCDAKGIMAAMICAAQNPALDEVGLLFLVSEETDSGGAKKAVHNFAPTVSYFINGEPTDLKITTAMKGALAFELEATGKTGHSAYPESGHSAIHQLNADLAALLNHNWPEDPDLGPTTLNVGFISGGRAGNVIADQALASCVMRTTVSHEDLQVQLKALIHPETKIRILTASSPTRFEKIEGFETCVVRFASDVPHLKPLGEAVLIGPGSILEAHTEHEQIAAQDLEDAVGVYERLCQQLLGKIS